MIEWLRIQLHVLMHGRQSEPTPPGYHPWMILYGSMLHIWWAVLLLLWPSSISEVSALRVYSHAITPVGTTILLTMCAVMAFTGLRYRRRNCEPWFAAGLLIPQQFILTMNALGALYYTLFHPHILPTSLDPGGLLFVWAPLMIAAVLHNVAVLDLYTEGSACEAARGQLLRLFRLFR